MLNRIDNSKGVSLVEVMIALVILLIVFVGLIQVSLVSIQGNMNNILRDEAVGIAADQMTNLRAAPFANVVTSPNTTISRNIRNVVAHPFIVATAVADPDANHKVITITVSWSWQGEAFTHVISAPRGR